MFDCDYLECPWETEERYYFFLPDKDFLYVVHYYPAGRRQMVFESATARK